jgi:acetyltransferase-like isoleucine patch superfamily enzyme
MPTDNVVRMIHSKTPDSVAMLANVKRAMAITARLNRLTFDDADEIRALFSQLIGKEVDESFLLIPPFYTACGDEIRVGRNVFVNQNCTFHDLGGLDIADDVLIGPNVSIITTSHPVEPSQRRAATIGKPIVIEKGVWIAAAAIIIGGVTVGAHSVVAAGSVVTKDVSANTLVGGNPARVIRSIAD